jgi:hypothetical protein
MEFFNSYDLRIKASRELDNRTLRSFSGSAYESADRVLANEASTYYSYKNYDIFLSHSVLDAAIVLGLKSVLEESGFSSYVYWVEDSSDRSQVTPETAERLKTRMKSCKALLYATSENADNSRWMPWELGYFDGVRGKVAVCPITYSTSFQGREYLGLYPIMEKDLWLHKDGKIFKKLRTWLDE